MRRSKIDRKEPPRVVAVVQRILGASEQPAAECSQVRLDRILRLFAVGRDETVVNEDLHILAVEL